MTIKVLILGGTREGRSLADALEEVPRVRALLSLAGRTSKPLLPKGPYRVGGFGGVTGLATFLQAEGFHALVDTTHPFAAQMSTNAVHAARLASIPLIRLSRASWTPASGDQWIVVHSMLAAANALGAPTKRVFLTVGRQEVHAFAQAPQHEYLVRAVEPFPLRLPKARLVCARGPFQLEQELALLQEHRIEILVSKNSATDLTYPKVLACRRLGIRIVMVAQPSVPPALEARTVDHIVLWLRNIHGDARERGE